MTERKQLSIVLSAGNRRVTATITEDVCVEDAYSMLLAAVLHEHVTGEDVVPSIDRDVKDALIKQRLVI